MDVPRSFSDCERWHANMEVDKFGFASSPYAMYAYMAFEIVITKNFAAVPQRLRRTQLYDVLVHHQYGKDMALKYLLYMMTGQPCPDN